MLPTDAVFLLALFHWATLLLRRPSSAPWNSQTVNSQINYQSITDDCQESIPTRSWVDEWYIDQMNHLSRRRCDLPSLIFVSAIQIKQFRLINDRWCLVVKIYLWPIGGASIRLSIQRRIKIEGEGERERGRERYLVGNHLIIWWIWNTSSYLVHIHEENPIKREK